MFLIIGTMILTTTLMITLPLEIMEEPPPIQAHRATQPTPLVQWDHSHHRLQAPVTLHMHSLLLHQEVIQVTYIYTSAIYRSPVGVKVVELKWQQFLKKMRRFLYSTNFNLLFCSVIKHTCTCSTIFMRIINFLKASLYVIVILVWFPCIFIYP